MYGKALRGSCNTPEASAASPRKIDFRDGTSRKGIPLKLRRACNMALQIQCAVTIASREEARVDTLSCGRTGPTLKRLRACTMALQIQYAITIAASKQRLSKSLATWWSARLVQTPPGASRNETKLSHGYAFLRTEVARRATATAT